MQAQSERGVAIQIYLALIAAVVLQLYVGASSPVFPPAAAPFWERESDGTLDCFGESPARWENALCPTLGNAFALRPVLRFRSVRAPGRAVPDQPSG